MSADAESPAAERISDDYRAIWQDAEEMVAAAREGLLKAEGAVAFVRYEIEKKYQLKEKDAVTLATGAINRAPALPTP